MKRLLMVVALLVLILPVTASGGDWKIYILGVDLDRIKEGGWPIVALGAVSSLISHRLGHTGYERLDSDETRGYGRAGFIVQSIVGLALTSFKSTRKSSFTKGWIGWTDLQLALYHQWHKDWGDFGTIEDQGGNRKRDYNAFCLIAVYNTFQIVR